MRTIDEVYIDGVFVTPRGDEGFDLFNPSTEKVIGRVRLADAKDGGALFTSHQRLNSKQGVPFGLRNTIC
ncbi:hypothetical protein PMI06_008769 [Burkholderia sp. BT03]|nr:hypothetical protein PMI06_008769 [Burkholderia sp. BT03]